MAIGKRVYKANGIAMQSKGQIMVGFIVIYNVQFSISTLLKMNNR